MLDNVSGRGSTRSVIRRSSHASSMLFRVELREKQAGLEMELSLKEMEVLKTKIPKAQNEVEMARLAESVEEEKPDDITGEDTKTEMLSRTEKNLLLEGYGNIKGSIFQPHQIARKLLNDVLNGDRKVTNTAEALSDLAISMEGCKISLTQKGYEADMISLHTLDRNICIPPKIT
ncbi:hypothetical protein FGIG_11189 [Fasciola gigantica]|uniref:Uncharacterized protein n=1 Tax=Fasciola gigantica TaxID=46835 RepID=A0A504YF56_FASGI|nr:hypothetical protein FGIG_11189 [Fasciola gigantica]